LHTPPGDPELVGVMAQLGSVDDETLSRVLATAYAGVLRTLVVQTAACRDRLTKELRRRKMPVPDILALCHAQPFRWGRRRGARSAAPLPSQQLFGLRPARPRLPMKDRQTDRLSRTFSP
jgi:hypothetical protein